MQRYFLSVSASVRRPPGSVTAKFFSCLVTNAGVACSKLGLADLISFVWNQYSATSYVIFFLKCCGQYTYIFNKICLVKTYKNWFFGNVTPCSFKV